MELLPIEDFVYPAVLPTVPRWSGKGDPVIADDLLALWRLILAIEKNVGIYPTGAWTTLERRALNANRVWSTNHTATDSQWASGVTFSGAETGATSSGATGPGFGSLRFVASPMVYAIPRYAPVSGAAWKFHAHTTSLSGTTIAARATGGGAPSGATSRTVSVIAVGYGYPGD